MSRVGIIDIGSNTFNFLICDTHTKKQLYFEEKYVGIRKGTNNQIINNETIIKSVSIINYFKEKCKSFKCKFLHLIATASLRNALNKDDFLKTCQQNTGLTINVISGKKEAKLIFDAVKNNLKISENYLIIDIGGASTEFIIVINNNPLFEKSYPFGSQSLIQKFKPSNPIKNEEIEEINLFFKKKIHEPVSLFKKYNITKIVGTSGSFESLAKIETNNLHHKRNYHSFNIKHYTDTIAPMIVKKTIQERKKIHGLSKMRAENIIITIILINFLISEGLQSICMTTFSLKDGIFFNILNKNITWRKSLL